MGFDALPKREFVTEFIYVNSFAYHHIWSTLKTLPATLSEPSSVGRGPRTGVTGTISYFKMTLSKGVGDLRLMRYFVFHERKSTQH